MKLLLHLFRGILTLLNKCLPKFEKVLIQGFPNIEPSAVEVHNYLMAHKRLKVYYVFDPSLENIGEKILNNPTLLKKSSLRFFFHYLTAKYIFFTHGSFLNHFSARQIVVNIWHGLCLKPVGRLIGDEGIKATVTAATSKFTVPMFTKSFGVDYESVLVTGYPRNDILLREKPNKDIWKEQLNITQSRAIIWLPTYRKSVLGNSRTDGKEYNSPFYLSRFDIETFNDFLEAEDVLCFVKPHPMTPPIDHSAQFSNIKFIDDSWLAAQGVTLYQLVSLTDMLISDVSSIICDYTLLDKPIVCVSEDMDEYRKTRGFYFDDIENWIPGSICRNSVEFMESLEAVLGKGNDPFLEKRHRLKNYFFDYEGGSTRRLVEEVFSREIKR